MMMKVTLGEYIWKKSLPVLTILETFIARLWAIFVYERKATQKVTIIMQAKRDKWLDLTVELTVSKDSYCKPLLNNLISINSSFSCQGSFLRF